MESSFNEKLAYSYPCNKQSPTCADYEDYDPCESSEDITEKDLAVLLKEEAAKLVTEKRKVQKTEAESYKKEKPLSGAYDKQTSDVDFVQEDENGPKKKSCKYIKNPFFTNRLEMATSHLPLPPPQPPPQNFPPAKDESSTRICPRKKKCKKDDKNRKPVKNNSTVSNYNGDVETVENDELDETDENLSEGRSNDENKDREESRDEGTGNGNNVNDNDNGNDNDNSNGNGNGNGNGIGMVNGIGNGNGKGKGKGKGKSNSKDTDKKQCKKKTIEKGPTCKKKELDEDINFQPRKIPYQQKDLPEISPKNIPEMQHQILMACRENEEDDCKKKCKKKTKTKG